MRKLVFVSMLFLSAALAVLYAASGKSKKSNESSLVKQGFSLISIMNEKAADEKYVSLVCGSEEMLSIVRNLKIPGNVEDCQIFRLGGDFSLFLNALLSGMGGSFDADAFSPQIKKDLGQRFLSGFASMWNGKTVGATWLAIASVLQSEKVFVSKELKEDCVYIFAYKDSYPVAVTFLRGEDNAVKACACYIFDENFVSTFSQFVSEMGLGIELEKIL